MKKNVNTTCYECDPRGKTQKKNNIIVKNLQRIFCVQSSEILSKRPPHNR